MLFGKKKKQIILEEITANEIKHFRNVFAIPDRITDQEIIATLINDLIRKYFNAEYWKKTDIRQLLDF